MYANCDAKYWVSMPKFNETYESYNQNAYMKTNLIYIFLLYTK